MEDKKKANPAVVVLLIVGIVGALGFAVKQFMNLSSTPMSPAEPVAAQQAPAATLPKEPAANPKTVVALDAAPTTDPFRPLPVSAQPQNSQAAQNPPRPPLLPPVPATNRPVPAPQLVAQDRAVRAAALRASTADTPSAAPQAPTAGSVAPMPVTVEPVLTGTLLGGRPMAVFKSESGSVLVPQGGAYMGWRVLRVAHGEAVVWNGAATLRLRVTGASLPLTRSAANPPAPPLPRASAMPSLEPDYAEGNCIRVHYTGRPALSKRELVFGRREELEPPLDVPMPSDSDTNIQPAEQPVNLPPASGNSETANPG